jgi:hypothetical protein
VRQIDEERVPIRMREYRAWYPECRATGGASIVAAFIAFGGQSTLIATASCEGFTACEEFGCDDQLVQKK